MNCWVCVTISVVLVEHATQKLLKLTIQGLRFEKIPTVHPQFKTKKADNYDDNGNKPRGTVCWSYWHSRHSAMISRATYGLNSNNRSDFGASSRLSSTEQFFSFVSSYNSSDRRFQKLNVISATCELPDHDKSPTSLGMIPESSYIISALLKHSSLRKFSARNYVSLLILIVHLFWKRTFQRQLARFL